MGGLRVLIAGAFAVLFVLGAVGAGVTATRRRESPTPAEALRPSQVAVFCTACGKPRAPEDLLCRSCGSATGPRTT